MKTTTEQFERMERLETIYDKGLDEAFERYMENQR